MARRATRTCCGPGHRHVLLAARARGLPAGVGRRRMGLGAVALSGSAGHLSAATSQPPVDLPQVAKRGRVRYILERNLLVYRHAWLVILSGFFEPVFYLLAIGVGI